MNETSLYERIWIRLVAVALGLMGFINIISAWVSFDNSRFKIIRNLFEYQLILGSRYLVVLTGFVAIWIAPQLFRQKRIAWCISVILLAVSGLAHIIKGADVEESSMCVLLLGILMPLYRYCYVKSDPIRLLRSGKILLGMIAFVLLYTFIGLHFFADQLGLPDDLSIWKMFIDTLLFDTSGLRPHGSAAKFFSDSILVINSFSLLIGLAFALSPVIVRTLPEINREKFWNIAKKRATQPIQFFSLTKDYMHFTENDESESFLSYKVTDSVAMAIGNPCTDGNITAITDKWINYVHEHDWVPAAYQVQGEFYDFLKKKGFYSIPIGVEALVDLETFNLKGKTKQSLRTAKNKAEKQGWYIRPFEYDDWEMVRKLDRKWLKIHGEKEITFAMGKSSPRYLKETNTKLLFDKNDVLLGYVNNIDLPGINGRVVDLMRRNPDAPFSGAIEMLFVNEILTAQADGKKYYDLGFSPLAQMDKSLADNKIAFNLLNLIFEKQSRYYDFQGLHRFKAKFDPVWKQSFLIYPSQVLLPRVLLALLHLNKGR